MLRQITVAHPSSFPPIPLPLPPIYLSLLPPNKPLRSQPTNISKCSGVPWTVVGITTNSGTIIGDIVMIFCHSPLLRSLCIHESSCNVCQPTHPLTFYPINHITDKRSPANLPNSNNPNTQSCHHHSHHDHHNHHCDRHHHHYFIIIDNSGNVCSL